MELFGIIVAGLAIVAAILLAPLAVIWALNTIFALSIAITFKAWLAMVVLLAIMSPWHYAGGKK